MHQALKSPQHDGNRVIAGDLDHGLSEVVAKGILSTFSTKSSHTHQLCTVLSEIRRSGEASVQWTAKLQDVQPGPLRAMLEKQLVYI